MFSCGCFFDGFVAAAAVAAAVGAVLFHIFFLSPYDAFVLIPFELIIQHSTGLYILNKSPFSLLTI